MHKNMLQGLGRGVSTAPTSSVSHFRLFPAPAFMKAPTGTKQKKYININKQQNSNRMIIFRLVSMGVGCPGPTCRLLRLLFIAFSFVKWKIADSIVCYLLPFWYENLLVYFSFFLCKKTSTNAGSLFIFRTGRYWLILWGSCVRLFGLS